MSDERAELLKGYSEEKKAWDATYPWIFYVARPVSFPLTLALRSIGATANHVTAFTAVLGAVSFPALASGYEGFMISGGVCLLLYTVFDCVDGNMARAWPETGSPAGKYWDGLVGNFYPLSYFALGIGVAGAFWIAVGAAITIAKLLAYGVKAEFWNTLGSMWEKEKKTSGYRPHTGSWYYKLYYNLTDPQAHIFLLPLILCFDFAREFLAASFLVAAAELAFITAFYIRRSAGLK